MNKINSKLPNIPQSIFSVMSQLAKSHNAINLSQGFPDFNCSEELISLVSKYQKLGLNQYAPMHGVPELLTGISDKVKSLYKKYYDPFNEIIITSGATEAIFIAISTLVSPGDEVILLEPAYDSYAPTVILNGGIPIFVPLSKTNFTVRFDLLKSKITNRTKAIIVNSPHNPTGSIISESDIKNFEEITRDKNIFFISDEVYEHILFDGNKHISFCSSEELSEKTFVISSFGKTYHTTGWKVGYCAAPQKMIAEFEKIHQFVVFSVNTPVQYAYAEYIKDEQKYLHLNEFYQQKRDIFLRTISKSKFKFTPARSTYFQLLDYSDISELDDITFASRLTEKYKIATIPLSPFYSSRYNEKLIRICFAKRDKVLIEAGEILNTIEHL